jgi:lipopolysaccharide assembly LptE-like protein
MRRVLVVLCALCSLCVLGVSVGCGYSLAGRGSFLPEYIRTIGVPTFANRTTVFNLETQLTQKVRAEFIGRGRYDILPEGGANVDALLTGEIISVTISPATFSNQQFASRFIIMMSARVELRETRDNKVLWENPGLVFRQEYEAQAGTDALDPAAFFGQDQNALEQMSTDFARTIVSSILEAF